MTFDDKLGMRIAIEEAQKSMSTSMLIDNH